MIKGHITKLDDKKSAKIYKTTLCKRDVNFSRREICSPQKHHCQQSNRIRQPDCGQKSVELDSKSEMCSAQGRSEVRGGPGHIYVSKPSLDDLDQINSLQ